MRADAYPLNTILNETTQWVVPVYQRHYEWKSDEEKQIPKLWDDLHHQTLELLDGRTQIPHYFGAIIFSEPSSQPFGTVRNRYLVDGQQRITTFHLVLSALREVARDLELDRFENTINAYLFNEKSKSMAEPEREQFKLWPSSYDRVLFQEILQNTPADLRQLQSRYFYKNGNLITGQAPNLLRAYLFLYGKIREFVNEREDEESNKDTMEGLLESFLSGFQAVLIQLDENDDAQEIFASLNGMAEPLAPFDLIRNDVFHRARKQDEDAETLFDQKWKSFEQPFWNQHVKQGRFKKARADHFVSHVVVAETAREVNLGKIAAEYQHYTRDRKFNSVASELDVLLSHGKTYRALEEMPKGAVTNRLSGLLKTWDLSTFHPLILWVDAQSISRPQKKKIYSIVENYIIRREICGLTTKNYNKVVTSLIRGTRGKSDIIEAFKTQLASLTGDASKMPQNAEVSKAFAQNTAYGRISSQKLRYILKNIEERMRTRYDEVTVSTENLTIEHVMPQRWARFWPLPNKKKAPCESVWEAIYDGHKLDDKTKGLMEERERIINTFGNLTLVTGSLNPSMGKKGWKIKRARLKKSLLVLNREIAANRVWNEIKIKNRSANLAKVSNRIWPGL